ncbi:MAG: hypothetical protein LBQ66_03255 [Planctomycetaceae bacterium]|nr:hypothetical protein [Planctomycetaceae bacterium]
MENFCPVNRIDEDIDARLHDQFVGRLARGDFETDDFVDEYNSNLEYVIPPLSGNVGVKVGSAKVEREGSLSGGCPSPHSPSNCTPPISNTGASKYRIDNCPTPPDRPEFSTKTLQIGGYDGGVEIGFEGSWYNDGFTRLIDDLEKAKQKASELSQSFPLNICGREVLVECTGAKAGLYYKYVFDCAGIKF